MNEGEGQRGHHDDEEEHGHLVLEEGPEGGAPVGVVGVAAPLRLLGVKPGEGEQLVVGHVGGGELTLQLAGQRVAQLVGFLVAIAFHQRAPSFLAKLIRGSTMPMRMSPNSRPRMEIAAYTSTSACTSVLS